MASVTMRDQSAAYISASKSDDIAANAEFTTPADCMQRMGPLEPET